MADKHTFRMCEKQKFHNWRHYSLCPRRAWQDGYCKQHHPDTIAERVKKQSAKWEAENKEWKARQEREAENKRKLEAFDDLLKLVEDLEWCDESEGPPMCPICGVWRDSLMPGTHAEDCQLDAILKKARGE